MGLMGVCAVHTALRVRRCQAAIDPRVYIWRESILVAPGLML